MPGARGGRRLARLSPNKDAAAVMLAGLLTAAEQQRCGLRDPTAGHARTPQSAHLADWEAGLAGGERGPVYVGMKLARVRAAVAGCGWVFPPDMTGDGLERFMAKLRTPAPTAVPIPPRAEGYTFAEAAGLSGGGTAGAVAKLVHRHGLAAAG